MSNPAIRQALEKKLAAVLPALPTAFENANFVTPVGPYQESYILFTRPQNLGYGNAPYIQRGYMQVNLNYPLGKGAGPAEQRGKLLQEVFYRGLSLAQDGVTTIIDETPEVTGGTIVNDRFVIRVFVRFYADIIPSGNNAEYPELNPS